MSASSAAMSALVVAAFEAGAVLCAAEVDEEEVAGGVLELLDEQAARSSAAPAAVIPNATRSARGLGLSCLPSGLKRFMRPRIYHTKGGLTGPRLVSGLISAGKIVNIGLVVIASRSGHYHQTLIRPRGMLSPRHIATRRTERVFKE